MRLITVGDKTFVEENGEFYLLKKSGKRFQTSRFNVEQEIGRFILDN